MTLLLALAAALAQPAPATDILAFSADPLGKGDDRTARALEDGIRASHVEALLACRPADADDAVGRILSTEAKMKLDGTVRSVAVKLSTGADAVDACATRILGTLRVDPPPMFADRIRINLRWQPPEAPDAE